MLLNSRSSVTVGVEFQSSVILAPKPERQRIGVKGQLRRRVDDVGNIAEQLASG